MADNIPTLHHLNNSQSQRILWLLEELGIEYNLVSHERNPANHPERPFHSPDSLVATGPYGKAPLLIAGAKDGNRYIPESSAIATYLIRTFDTKDSFGLENGDWIRDEVLCSLCSTNIWVMVTLMMDFGALKKGTGHLGEGMDGPGLEAWLRNLEREFKEGPEGGFFMGKSPGRADIMLEYPLTMVKARSWANLEKDFPALDKWLMKVRERPAFKRSLEKGNGYDMSVFPKGPHA